MTTPATTAGRPSLVVFDVNETLSDLSALGARFVEVGASASTARLWFASTLRDGFALTAAGHSPLFAELARGLLVSVLSEATVNRSVEEAADLVMEGFGALELHPDVASGVHQLHENGFRLVTLSNGSASVARRLLEGGPDEHFERLLSVEDAGAWKPAPQSYAYALSECGVAAGDALLVSVHPWDVDGARRAGLQAAWVNRTGAPWPGVFEPPTYTVASIEELPELWRSEGGSPSV